LRIKEQGTRLTLQGHDDDDDDDGHLNVFGKAVEKKISCFNLKFVENNGHFTRRLFRSTATSLGILLTIRTLSEEVQKIKARVLC